MDAPLIYHLPKLLIFLIIEGAILAIGVIVTSVLTAPRIRSLYAPCCKLTAGSDTLHLRLFIRTSPIPLLPANAVSKSALATLAALTGVEEGLDNAEAADGYNLGLCRRSIPETRTDSSACMQNSGLSLPEDNLDGIAGLYGDGEFHCVSAGPCLL